MKITHKKVLRGANGSTVQEWVHSSRSTVSPSHTTMYSWYKIVSPGGYSSAGTPGVWEIHCHISGNHATSAILQKFTLVQSNNHAHIADHGGANHSLCYRFCNIDPGGGAYGVSLTVNCYYLSTDAGNNGATFFFKCTHAAREPHFTFYAKYIGGTGAGSTGTIDGYTPSTHIATVPSWSPTAGTTDNIVSYAF